MPWGISHKYKFIFIHIPSTAGTSICSIWEGALLKEICKDNGVVGGSHKTALDIKKAFQKEFDEYYKFCVVRNPFDRFISKFFFKRYSPINQIYFDWNDREAQALLPQLYWITGHKEQQLDDKTSYARPDAHYGEIIIDKVIRFENMIDELRIVFNKLGVPVDVDNMPNFHKLHAPVSRECYLNDIMRSVVSYMYRDDLHRLGYSWDGP
jgi:hypothetical protein